VVWLVIFVWGMGAIMLALFRSIRAEMDAAALPPPAPAPSPAAAV